MENYPLNKLFNDEEFAKKIQRLLPELFEIAEIESSRAGRIGMEVGNLRERILVSMLIHKFGIENVDTEIPTTEPEVDVKVSGRPLSIKTITNKYLTGVKLKWTVDTSKSKEFLTLYKPTCDLLVARIQWDSTGGLHFIPQNVQESYFEEYGKDNYLKLPKPGTNPRGIEISRIALESLANDKESRTIEINWNKRNIDYDPYKRWLDYWSEGINENN